MNLDEKTTKKTLGLIMATMMEHQNSDKSSKDDVNEIESFDNAFTTADPELKYPNFIPKRNQEHQDSELEKYSGDDTHGRDRNDLINPIDSLNNVSNQHDVDPDEKHEIDHFEDDEEPYVEEKDDFNEEAQIPKEQNSDTDIDEDKDDYLQERDFSLGRKNLI